ncbi:DMT family transporter [Ramlibacter montanisoli]|uniref:DMT family transporter n=1 Tax=Ramlibacter montanisoli TaxID=2732512 RepID=A0A849KEL2_9BURK|nr:DMT family transporter [Ramlibacter montanisoli]NNU42643.1 DMT family transporter [Ramlibacter montanisoli]
MNFPTTDAARAANRRGILAMAGGMACFVVNDSLVKHVSESLPGPQLIFLRGIFATLLLVAIAHGMRATARLQDLLDRRVLLRALFDAFATMAYLTSLFHLPIANATAINMATPLFITLFAVVAFKERVGAGRWLAIATGFTGVLLVVQPTGAAFNAYALLCLGGTLLHASRDLMTRVIDRGIPSILITLSTAIAVTVLAGAWSLFSEWRDFRASQAGPAGGRQRVPQWRLLPADGGHARRRDEPDRPLPLHGAAVRDRAGVCGVGGHPERDCVGGDSAAGGGWPVRAARPGPGTVIPAEAGTRGVGRPRRKPWVPASAGMTNP